MPPQKYLWFLLIPLAAIFKVDAINQKYSPRQDGFLGKIDSIGKGNAEIVSLKRPAPWGENRCIVKGRSAFKNLLTITPQRGHSLNDEFAVKPHFGHLGDVLMLSSRFCRPKIDF